jgi:hypothetical protein
MRHFYLPRFSMCQSLFSPLCVLARYERATMIDDVVWCGV